MRIHLRNWYGWADQTLELGACHFVVGVNGIGKTSAVRDALEFAYLGTGELRGIKQKKTLASEAIRDVGVDVEGCEVTVELAGKRVRRTMDHEGKQEAFLSTWEDALDQWGDEEPMALKRDQGSPWGDEPDDLVRCLLEPTHFSTLDGSRRQEVLIKSTSDGKAERQAVLEALNAKLEPETDEDVAAIESAATWVASDGFRSGEDAAIEQRKEAKREAAVVVVGDEPEKQLAMGEERFLDLAEHPTKRHEDHLAKLRSDHTAAVRAESAGAGAIAGQLAEAEQAFARFETQGEPKADAVGDKRLGPLPKEPGSEAPLAAQVEEADAARQVALQVLAAESEKLKAARLAAEGARDQVAQVTSFERPSICPLGPAGMPCPVKPSLWNPAVERRLGDQDAIEAQVQEGMDEVARLVASVEYLTTKAEYANGAALAVRHQAEALGREWQSWRDHGVKLKAQDEADARARVALQKRQEAWLLAFEKAGERVEELRKALAAAQAGEQPEGPTSEELAGRIGVGEGVVQASRDYWREKAAWLERSKKRADLDDTVKRWDAICQLLKPEGIETALGGHAREAFLQSLEDVAGLAGEVLLSETCGLSVRPYGDDQPARSLHQLSESQRLSLGVSIQHALCQLASFPVLVVDRVDVFDKSHREAWAAMAQGMAGREAYGTIVGLATIQKAPRAPGGTWRTSWLKPDGSVEVLGG
jgi:hypothetical protein